MMVHKGEKAHQCDICSKTFTQKYTLTKHLRIHSGETPYKCNICPQSFRLYGRLVIHLNRHKGVTPFSCTLCPKSFGCAGSLRSHLENLHTKEGPYKCLVCLKEFVCIKYLTIHMKQHTAENKCVVCSKTFSHKCHLNIHARLHTGNRPYKCEVCLFTFIYKKQLHKHVCDEAVVDRRMLTSHNNVNTDNDIVQRNIGENTIVMGTSDEHCGNSLSIRDSTCPGELSSSAGTGQPQKQHHHDRLNMGGILVGISASKSNLIKLEHGHDSTKQNTSTTFPEMLHTSSTQIKREHSHDNCPEMLHPSSSQIKREHDLDLGGAKLATHNSYQDIPLPTSTQIKLEHGHDASKVNTNNNSPGVLSSASIRDKPNQLYVKSDLVSTSSSLKTKPVRLRGLIGKQVHTCVVCKKPFTSKSHLMAHDALFHPLT
jgi:uncharacterized Zn-finger protein